MERVNSEVSNTATQSVMLSEIQIHFLKLTGIQQLKMLSIMEWTGDVLLTMNVFMRC